MGMRWVWLVLAVLIVLASNAVAERAACTCPTASVLPERGATDVPINAKIWQLGPGGDVHRPQRVSEGDLIGVRVIERPLAPDTELRDDALGVSFTTASERDTTPPAAPRDATVVITTEDDDPYSSLTSIAIGGV